MRSSRRTAGRFRWRYREPQHRAEGKPLAWVETGILLLAALAALQATKAFGRYDILVCPPSFPFGGMENPRLTFVTPTVLAGVRVGENGMVGAAAVATKDVRPYHVNVGIPAKSIAVKSTAPPEHARRARIPPHSSS